MTKKEMCSRVADWNRQITRESITAGRYFNDLQKLAEECTGASSCSAEQNVIFIISANKDSIESYKALELYMKLSMEEGKHEALASFLRATDSFNL